MENQAKFCSKCGARIPLGAKFCTHCGAAAMVIAAVPEQPASPAVQSKAASARLSDEQIQELVVKALAQAQQQAEAEEKKTVRPSAPAIHRCPVCGAEIAADAVFCDACGTRLKH